MLIAIPTINRSRSWRATHELRLIAEGLRVVLHGRRRDLPGVEEGKNPLANRTNLEADGH